jgi:hypothetical protein
LDIAIAAMRDVATRTDFMLIDIDCESREMIMGAERYDSRVSGEWKVVD